MKSNLTKAFLLTMVLAMALLTATAQTYKTLSDTAKLNKEYKQVQADITELNSKLTADQQKTSDYQDKTDKLGRTLTMRRKQVSNRLPLLPTGTLKT